MCCLKLMSAEMITPRTRPLSVGLTVHEPRVKDMMELVSQLAASVYPNNNTILPQYSLPQAKNYALRRKIRRITLS